jgi:hypothetical protein
MVRMGKGGPMRCQDLIDAALARTGLAEFGADSFREGLEVLLRSLRSDADLSSLGEAVVGGQLVGLLANRLQIEEWYRRRPDIEAEEVTAPLFGLGLPRTGSTALSFLLAMDPGRRSVRTWEASSPCPPPETATEHSDPRIAETQAGLDEQARLFPGFADMLPTSATGPQECIQILAFDFRSMTFEGMARIPTYSEWLFSCDMEPAYRYHKRVLKLLQWRCPPKRWWLKTPSHMHAIEALDRVYPDARFVMTHRDVTTVIPSVAAVISTLSGMLTEHPDPAYLGRHNADVWETALHRLIAFRDGGADDRFFDIAFGEMQAGPLDVVRRLYRWLGSDLDAEAERRMTDWWEHNAKQRHGSHHYQPADYGIDTGDLRERFGFYTQRFDVAPDAG